MILQWIMDLWFKTATEFLFCFRTEMQNLANGNEFIETAEFSGNQYGTSKQAVQDVLQSGKICILDIDVLGVKAVKKTDLDPKYVFIKPPSLQVLEHRLRARGTETEASLGIKTHIRLSVI